MATFPVWLKTQLITLSYILLYWFIELLTFSSTLTLGIAVCHWITKLVHLASKVEIHNIGQTYIVIYCVGLVTAGVPVSWRLSLTPASLDDFQDRRHPVIFGAVRIFTISATLVFSTVLFYFTYQFKYDAAYKEHVATEDRLMFENDLYINDLVFLLSLSLMTYVLARLIQFYRETNRFICMRQLPPDEELIRPCCAIFLIYYFCLVILELICSAPIFALMSLFTASIGSLQAPDYVTYFIPVVFGYFGGNFLGHLEQNHFSLDKRFQRREPYFTTIHWDARLNMVVFTFVPFLSRWYYHNDSDDDSQKMQGIHGYEWTFNYHYYLFCGSIATTYLQFSKCQTLFSYILLEGSLQGPRLLRRVHPENRLNSRDDNQPAAPLHQHKSRAYFYFPLDLSRKSMAGDRDQASVSTGTCTSLLSRINNNNNNNGQDIVSLANSMKTCPRSPETEPEPKPEKVPSTVLEPDLNLAEIIKDPPLPPRQPQVFIVNQVEVIESPILPQEDDYEFENEQDFVNDIIDDSVGVVKNIRAENEFRRKKLKQHLQLLDDNENENNDNRNSDYFGGETMKLQSSISTLKLSHTKASTKIQIKEEEELTVKLKRCPSNLPVISESQIEIDST